MSQISSFSKAFSSLLLSRPLLSQPQPTLPESFIPASMPEPPAVTGAGSREPSPREIGGLFASETWWRDRYYDIEARGYRLRPRYHPDWQPSWKQSGKDFSRTEDGQATIVSILCLVLRLAALTTLLSHKLSWMLYKYKMADKSCSRRFFLKSPPMNYQSQNCSPHRVSKGILEIVVFRCSTSSICPKPNPMERS
jgi:hypothetical protein